jgi:hypothetical protein
MTTWLLFPDEATAQAAVATIDTNMGFPLADGSTLTWRSRARRRTASTPFPSRLPSIWLA